MGAKADQEAAERMAVVATAGITAMALTPIPTKSRRRIAAAVSTGSFTIAILMAQYAAEAGNAADGDPHELIDLMAFSAKQMLTTTEFPVQ